MNDLNRRKNGEERQACLQSDRERRALKQSLESGEERQACLESDRKRRALQRNLESGKEKQARPTNPIEREELERIRSRESWEERQAHLKSDREREWLSNDAKSVGKRSRGELPSKPIVRELLLQEANESGEETGELASNGSCMQSFADGLIEAVNSPSSPYTDQV